MSQKSGVIYILTNPSFREYVKIGYINLDVDVSNGNTLYIS